jgi:hypothetical protein
MKLSLLDNCLALAGNFTYEILFHMRDIVKAAELPVNCSVEIPEIWGVGKTIPPCKVPL